MAFEASIALGIQVDCMLALTNRVQLPLGLRYTSIAHELSRILQFPIHQYFTMMPPSTKGMATRHKSIRDARVALETLPGMRLPTPCSVKR